MPTIFTQFFNQTHLNSTLSHSDAFIFFHVPMKPLYGFVPLLVAPCNANLVFVSQRGLKSRTNMTPASVPASNYDNKEKERVVNLNKLQEIFHVNIE